MNCNYSYIIMRKILFLTNNNEYVLLDFVSNPCFILIIVCGYKSNTRFPIVLIKIQFKVLISIYWLIIITTLNK